MAWSDDELRLIGDAEELRPPSGRVDGALSAYTTMWVVRVGDDIYVRSAGRTGPPVVPTRREQWCRSSSRWEQ